MGIAEKESLEVLIVEDDANLSRVLKDFFEGKNYLVECSSTAAEAKENLSTRTFDLALVDYRLPDETGLTLFDEIKKRSPLTRVLVMTGYRDLDLPVKALRLGAADFFFKPFSLTELEERIQKLIEQGFSRNEILPNENPDSDSTNWEMVGESESLKRIQSLISVVAKKNITVLITGESGTGKELVARALHTHSLRSGKSMISINCAAIPDTLLEDELFGHVPGAFTDARESRKGVFEEADGGTLFLDEIGEIPLGLQAKLLRVLEDSEIPKLGSSRSVPVDTRIIAATNADLKERIERNAFRADLYYRLNLVRLHLPPLRERMDDIPLLANHFLSTAATRYELPIKQLSPSALRYLLNYDWPGNVRELRNAVEGAVLFSDDRLVLEEEDVSRTIETDRSPKDSSPVVPYFPDEGVDLNQIVADLEKNLISEALQRTGGNKKEAAKLLELKRTTLVAKLKKMEQFLES